MSVNGNSVPNKSNRRFATGRNLSSNKKSNDEEGIRVNKCLTGHSRRSADKFIEEGAVTVNNEVATLGTKVYSGDKVRLDGQIQRWEELVEAKKEQPSKILDERSLIYIKYFKPVGVTCTSDKKDKNNIIEAGGFNLFPQRLFTVGRLDKESTGLILLTSDGRVNNAMLNFMTNKEKVYDVTLNDSPTDADIQRLCDGVMITTPTSSSRDGNVKLITAKTRPCKVTRVGPPISRRLQFCLTEGRNRQIRRMVDVIGFKVISLHRTAFAGITLKGLAEGNWAELTEREMGIIQNAIAAVPSSTSSRTGGNTSGRGPTVAEEDFDE